MNDLARETRGREFADDSTMSWDAEQVRGRHEAPQPRQRTHPPRRRKRRSRVGYYVVLLLISAILAGVGWLLCSDMLALNKPAHTAEIVVEDSSRIGDVATELKKAGLIEYKAFFNLYAAMSDTNVVAGKYELNSNMDYHALLNAMSARSGVRKTVDVTIPEGYSMQQIFELLASKNVNTVEDLMEAAASGEFDYAFLEGKEAGNASRLEGYLFPDTYQFYCGGKPESVIKKMLNNFENKLEPLMETVESSPYTLDEIVTIASLIEKETDGSDQAKISSVIRNRLKNSGETAGYLQIDAALQYALGEHKETLTEADKKVDSPYNLYENKGLPPTAIANPGISSIRAALYPDSTSYYFYALGDDGVHHFFKTYREHVNFTNSQQMYQ